MKTVLLMLLAAIPASVMAQEESSCEKPVTEGAVKKAQDTWGNAIVAIGASDNPEEAANDALDRLYAYDKSAVLFKPTLASIVPFRGTKTEALSYFVGGKFAEDKGFALAPYNKVRFENEGIITYCNSALAMGEYYFTKSDGTEVKVEYSFGYMREEDGDLKINLHHSSLPYKAQKEQE